MHKIACWLPEAYKPRGKIIKQNNNILTKDLKCAGSYAMSLYNIHYLPTPLTLPQQGKYRHPTGCTLPLLHRVFQKLPMNRLQMVLRSHGCAAALWGQMGKFQGHRHCRHSLIFAGERLITGNHSNQQNKSNLIPEYRTR